MAFFTLLSTDLHVCILKTWLADSEDDRPLMRVLASMDTSQVHREQLLALGRLPFLWRASYQRRSEDVKVIWWYAPLLDWLVLRRMPVRVLHVYSTKARLPVLPAEHFPSVETIEFGNMAGLDAGEIGSILAACPNVTSVIMSNFQRANAASEALATIAPKHLRWLVFSKDITFRSEPLLDVLEVCGGNLRDLGLGFVSHVMPETLVTIGNLCPYLEVLDMDVARLSTESLCCFVRCSLQLEDLTLRDFRVRLSDMAQILEAGRGHLKRFTTNSARFPVSCQIFADVLEQHQWLDFLQLKECSYDRIEGTLQLGSFHHPYSMELATLEQIINACGMTTKLIVEICDDLPIGPRLALLGDRLGSTLRELKIVSNAVRNNSAPHDMVYVAQQAPSLTSVDLSADGFNDDAVAKLVSACHELQLLKLKSTVPCVASNATVEALFINCRQLQTVNLFNFEVDHFCFVKAMLNNRVRLKNLLAGFRMSEAERVELRELIKKMQILPVPK